MARVQDSSKRPFFLILGPPNAGKTTLMYRLYSGIFYTAVQVDNRNVEEVRVDNVRLRTLNIVENNLKRETWIPFTVGSTGTIFVVDSTSNNIEVTRTLFQNVRAIEDLKEIPLLMCINKIDLKENFNFKELEIDIKNNVRIQEISCKTTEGILEGMMWLMEKTKTSFYIPTFRKLTNT